MKSLPTALKLIINTKKLGYLIKNNPENLKIVCSTWNMGKDALNPLDQFNEHHIKGSAYFCIERIADNSTGFLASWPSTDLFIKEMKRLGIKKNQTIVLYDHVNIFSVARAAAMLRAFGAKDVHILNGCLKKWIEEGRHTEAGPPEDVNDTSDEGYDYVLNEDYVDNYETTFKKVAAVESNSFCFTIVFILYF